MHPKICREGSHRVSTRSIGRSHGHVLLCVGLCKLPVGRLNISAFLRQIAKHLLKQGLDYVVVDVTGFHAVQRRAVFTYLRGLRPADRARIIIQRSRS